MEGGSFGGEPRSGGGGGGIHRFLILSMIVLILVLRFLSFHFRAWGFRGTCGIWW